MPDPRLYRSDFHARRLHCAVCGEIPNEVEDTALHFGLPPSRFGIIFVRVKCHGEQQDLACSFEWAKNHPNDIITVFDPKHPVGDLGLSDLIYRDGFSLPDQAKSCAYQIENEENHDLWYYPHVDERFIRQMNRLIEGMSKETRAKWDKVVRNLHDMVDALNGYSFSLAEMIKLSRTEPVATAAITELTSNLALLCMRINAQIGTPEKMPTNEDGTIKWIDDAINKPADDTILFDKEKKKLTR